MRLNRGMLLYDLADRLSEWWTYRENIIFDCPTCNQNKIKIYQDYSYIGYIQLQPQTIIVLKETLLTSLIRAHIRRVLGCSIRPTTIEFITVESLKEIYEFRLPAPEDPLCSPERGLEARWN